MNSLSEVSRVIVLELPEARFDPKLAEVFARIDHEEPIMVKSLDRPIPLFGRVLESVGDRYVLQEELAVSAVSIQRLPHGHFAKVEILG